MRGRAVPAPIFLRSEVLTRKCASLAIIDANKVMRVLSFLQTIRWAGFLLACVFVFAFTFGAAAADGNRLTYLDESDPFYVHLNFPKLTTPQWVGEPGVEAVVVLAIDDLRDTKKYETVLRPILERLKQIDGRAPVSIFCNAVDAQHEQFQAWLREGLSLEVHTLSHPCPLLAKGNFQAAADTVHGGVDLLNRIPGNKAVAYRMPCCDSINSPSPRFYSEIFNRTNALGQFLTIDSSVMNIPTPKDASMPRELVTDANSREKFRKYLPFPSFVTTIEDYPYPYVIGKLCWEFPAMVPSDWEAQHLHGTNNPVTVADWKAALDATVLKKGLFTYIFHPHGWIRPDQMVEFVDYAVRKHGKKVKFLTFREAQERIDKNLLAGQPLRAANGQDNGVRLVDLNQDGYLDVIIGNERLQRTRLWKPDQSAWLESELPVSLIKLDQNGSRREAGVRFGVVGPQAQSAMFALNEQRRAAWRFESEVWIEDRSLLSGLDIDGQPIVASEAGRDRGVRLRDFDKDGQCELVVGNEKQNSVFAWSGQEKSWKKLSYGLPKGTSIVDARGRDNGLRFVDINEDGFDDAIASNELSYSLHLFVPKLYLGFQPGWTRDVLSGKRGEAGELPMIVRGGENRNNGAWFHSKHLWVQNEDTATLKDLVDRRSFSELVGGLQPAAKSPEASLECIQVRAGFKVELVAHEPLVQDPIAFEWGPDGKLWVVEMGDYPLGIDGKGKSGGIVRFLEDADGDGRYDKSTVFLQGVNFPTGVMPWRKGVLISAAPEIFYAEDTNGDGKADVRTTLFKGFREGNQQHRVNGFEYGLDNWIYGANGDSGGSITAEMPTDVRRTGGVSLSMRPVDIRGHDFRFQPDARLFEAVAGQTQFGRHRDDWGNWFGNNNPAWLWHYHVPEHYLARNQNLAVKTLKQYLANYPESSRVYATSRTLQRFNDIGMVNHVTSGNSATPYRDELFGPDFATSVFISEPVHNVVHHEVLEPDGVTFTSHRPPDEQGREFLASSDNWFRPTMLKTGPDGALYIADMYRLVLEHPEWIPPDTQKQFDLRAGHDKGRIYRVYPTGAKLRKIPRLDGLNTAGLVEAIKSPNGWERDTAQRLLVHSQSPSAAGPLQDLVREGANPKTRLQALCTLDGLRALEPKVIISALRDSHPAVREHAVRMGETFMKRFSYLQTHPDRETSKTARTKDSPAPEVDALRPLANALLKLSDDPSIRVRYQLAFTLGEWEDARAGQALVKIAVRDLENQYMQIAVMSSARPHVRVMLDAALNDYSQQPPVSLLEQLIGLATSLGDTEALFKSITEIARKRGSQYAAWQLKALNGLLNALERRNDSLEKLQGGADPKFKQAIQGLDGLFVQARLTAIDEKASELERVAAISLLGRGRTERPQDRERLRELLLPQVPNSLQRTALTTLSQSTDANTADILLQGWKGYGPALRTEVLNALLTRTEWSARLMAAIESQAVTPSQIGPAHQQKLLNHSQSLIRERARKLFATAADRKQVLQNYQQVAGLKGDLSKGAALYRQHCASCHRFRNEGTDIGPDLGTVSSKSMQAMLLAVLDPNQAVEARYLSYTAVTKNDRDLSGIIVAEAPGSITLRTAGGTEEVILRSDLKGLNGSGLSLMPEGFEKALTPQDLANLIAYIAEPSKL
jgi:putative membrane-bound dehydrogenase-like protein